MNAHEMQQIMQTDISRYAYERGRMRFFQFGLTLSRRYLNGLLPVYAQEQRMRVRQAPGLTSTIDLRAP